VARASKVHHNQRNVSSVVEYLKSFSATVLYLWYAH